MNPLAFLSLIPRQVLIFLAIILTAGIVIWMYGNSQYRQGEAAVQAKWDAERAQVERDTAAAQAKREAENAALAEAHRKEMNAQRKKYEDEIARNNRRFADDAARRLRLPATVCTDRPAGPPAAEGTEGGDAAAAGTIALPDDVARNLRQLAAEADAIVASCRQAQDFIRQHGLEEK